MHTSKPLSRGTGRSGLDWPATAFPALRLACALLLVAWAVTDAVAQSLPLEIRQDAVRYNASSTNGLPLSNVRGFPAGSDGRAPSLGLPGTTNQFSGLVNFGSVVKPASAKLNPNLDFAANAENLNLPRMKVNGQIVLTMTRARVGAPWLGRSVSFLFGEVVPPPASDEFGVLLSVVNTNVVPNRPVQSPSSYWIPEPYTTTDHANAAYYWSPHAQSVFAVSPGPLRIVWRRSASSSNATPPPDSGTATVFGVPYVVWTNQYVISGSPVKRPRLMYWTERTFAATGKLVDVPSARVGAIKVVYNNNFPERDTKEVEIPGIVPQVTTNTLSELRTLWYEQSGGLGGGQIHAYNREGRVFVEILGDVRAGDTRQHLGFEIVDVVRQPAPNEVTIELGDKLTAYPGGTPSDSDLFPSPILVLGQDFSYLHVPGGTTRPDYYANRETRNQNDLQFHWLEEGLQGLLWPYRFVRYSLVWPDEVSRYTHYVRPEVATAAEAKATAVLLPSQNAPTIAYQDPLDGPRGFMTETFTYYSYLDVGHPAHRALLRFTSGDFIRYERVFSWLDRGLRTLDSGAAGFASSVATNLSAWNPNLTFSWSNEFTRPRVVSTAVAVGDRITAPIGEIGNAPDTNYLAGFIRESEGNLYQADAYVNPFEKGFDQANLGSIIPVNAIPGKNRLEVWWFRKNAVDVTQGFRNTYWPSVIGRYTLQWPSVPSEIVLASNDGSGPLTSLQANGRIYFENDAAKPGYNPNEEHALVQGGQAFALRDDLNITTGSGYTSDPFVLLAYTESDGRPAMRTFKVLREKPEAGIVFDYAREAGTILQAPMPLPLLEKPLAPSIAGQPPKSLNKETATYVVASSSQGAVGSLTGHSLTTTARHFAKRFDPVSLQNPASPAQVQWFFPTNVSRTTLGGWVSQIRPLSLRPWSGAQNALSTRWRFAALVPQGLVSGASPALVYDVVTGTGWRTTVSEVSAESQYVELEFPSDVPLPAKAATMLVMPVSGPGINGFAGQRLAPEPLPTTLTDDGMLALYGRFTLQDRKGDTWFYRGPHKSEEAPSMVMQFYYKTLPGFFFPSLPLNSQPPVGTVTPYLRPLNPDGTYEGAPVYGNATGSDQEADGNALGITYRPVWPENVPILQMAETLTTPKRGLPAARGQSSLEVLYQQSHTVGGETFESAVLHDPTREKSFALSTPGDTGVLDGIPPSVKSQTYQGKTYFPNLPPHLAERLFFDPTRGAYGELVFKGQFIDAPLGDKYVFLNVLGEGDMAELKALCDINDDKKARWDAAIEGLSAVVDTFVENPAKPRTYIPNPALRRTVGATELARVVNDDQDKDSYALSATGPGVGYVSLIAGNGRAFTPEGDPVSVKVIRVVDTLYRGEVNIVESSNPLNERLTLQQVTDLAAKVEDYSFEWKIASPVDGKPPVVYRTVPFTVADGSWSHLPFPVQGDTAVNAPGAASSRVVKGLGDSVVPVSGIPFSAVQEVDGRLRFSVAGHNLIPGNRLVIRKTDGTEVLATVNGLTRPNDIYVTVDPNQKISLSVGDIGQLNERVNPNGVQSILFRQFEVPAGDPSEAWLSLDLVDAMGARVYIDGQLAVQVNIGAGDTASTPAPAPLHPLPKTYRLSSAYLGGGTLNPNGSRTHNMGVELISSAFPNQAVSFDLRLESFTAVDVTDEQWLPLDSARYVDGVRAVLGGNADVRSLSDNYLIMRYQPKNEGHASYVPDGLGGNAVWSQWTTPQLAEGWIKRVLKGINPFNQRITDLFNNSVNTDVSIVAQAGQRWEGDVALNLDAINNAGLIEIYETVLGRGKMLSIGGGINYGPANDALLLAAGYLNDLYMMLGNEAWADASNPTIGIGSKDNTYGAIATAMFSFKGQLPSLLEEELALMRGRDDFLLPGVELRPVYNRLVWNYTRGIDSGEVVYSLNYNILDQNGDGKIDAEDARRLFPQGHGDAYGHYLTALKGYYSLLLDNNFDWVPRIEAVTVLGKPVSVDYQDERKFAAAAGALARAGKQVFDLTWRRDYQAPKSKGWSHLSQSSVNSTTRSTPAPTTRYWGADHWAARTGQGAYLNWIVGNAILPDRDPDPSHEGSIQQIDRTTVPELKELAAISASLQTAMDNAEGGSTPVGLPSTTVPFDLNPGTVVGLESTTHFEQVFGRAKRALNNAIVAFDDAKDVTRLMRSEQDSLSELRTAVNKQELAYTNTLIELYGTPYPEDIGPGKTYRTGFAGPDTIHYSYVDTAELTFTGPQGALLDPTSDATFRIDTQTFQPDWADKKLISDFNWIKRARKDEVDGNGADPDYLANTNLYVEFNLSSHGFFKKPAAWTGQRATPGKIQQAISDIVRARNAAYTAFYWADAAKYDLDWAISSLDQKVKSHKKIVGIQEGLLIADVVTETTVAGLEVLEKGLDSVEHTLTGVTDTIVEAMPKSLVAGLAFGGDLTSPARAAAVTAGATAKLGFDWKDFGFFSAIKALELANKTSEKMVDFYQIHPEEWYQDLRGEVSSVRDKVYGMNNQLMTINQRLQELDDAKRKYRALIAEGDRIQLERQIFRQRSAAVIQGYRTRDAAFRIFRNEKLERYKTLFDLASQYAFMSAQAYDYETGLLHSDQGRDFIQRIIRARALGIVQGGEPQFAGSNTGDPGLSSAMAEMYADWTVLKSRLGFSSPDAYSTTVSLRTENFRILPGTNGNSSWKDVLNQARKANILDDPDVRRYCMQIDNGSGLQVPGIVLEFSTTIAEGLNLFGHPLAADDHAYSPSSFATKIFGVGVALEGYQGMDNPSANSTSGGTSPTDPNLSFLDPNHLSATPYVYLVPVGVDSMRSPPLGDQGGVLNWSIDDVAIPLPFNIGGSQFSTAQIYQSGDSLSEQPFVVRKHQAFRPVSTTSVFATNPYSGSGLARSQFTNNRLIGRSVWNSKWKLIIPGNTLLNNPDEGLERFLRTVRDVKLHFVTYSYSGN